MINFIAKPPFEMKHLQRVSSIVRGEQIAAYMGDARLNPETIDEGDTNIFVKPHIKPGTDFDFPKHSWVDIQDGWELVETLKRYPDVGVIAYGDLAYNTLYEALPQKEKIAIIPHHHLNFERTVRNRDKIKKVGITGSGDAFKAIPEEIKEGLKKRNIQLEYYSNFYPRMSVAKFHESLDIHMHWRPFLKRKLSCPFKIINAASFGVPTIALDEPSFSEVKDTYIPVKTASEWLDKFDYLRETPWVYYLYKEKCLEMAEKYHISKIAELYRRLQ
jgi:hypothetical protein